VREKREMREMNEGGSMELGKRRKEERISEDGGGIEHKRQTRQRAERSKST